LNRHVVLWRTPDHTPVQELFEHGMVTEEAFTNHPLQNQLLRTINLYHEPEADIFLHSPLGKDETIVLCTDGFWTATPFSTFLKFAYIDDYQMQIKQHI